MKSNETMKQKRINFEIDHLTFEMNSIFYKRQKYGNFGVNNTNLKCWLDN